MKRNVPVRLQQVVLSALNRTWGARVRAALDTGQVQWVNELRGGRDATSPIYADGKLFSYRCPAYHGGSLFMLEATPKACRVLGMVKNLAANCTSPALVDGRLYVRVLDGVVCYDLRKETQP